MLQELEQGFTCRPLTRPQWQRHFPVVCGEDHATVDIHTVDNAQKSRFFPEGPQPGGKDSHWHASCRDAAWGKEEKQEEGKAERNCYVQVVLPSSPHPGMLWVCWQGQMMRRKKCWGGGLELNLGKRDRGRFNFHLFLLLLTVQIHFN